MISNGGVCTILSPTLSLVGIVPLFGNPLRQKICSFTSPGILLLFLENPPMYHNLWDFSDRNLDIKPNM